MPKDNRWWTYPAEKAAALLETHPSLGLRSEEAAQRLTRVGPNQIPESKGRPLWRIFLNQFQSFIVAVLAGAAIIAGFLGEWIDSVVIGAILFLNAGLGFFQEYHAEKSLAALKKLSASSSKVYRDGILQNIYSSEIVPGDILLLEAGDKIPADARVLESHQSRTQEAALTGESKSVKKAVHTLSKENLPLSDRSNMVFMGTVVVAGKLKALVTETGLATELGKIAGMLMQEESSQTPLQKQLEKVGKWLVAIFLGVVGIVFLMGLLRGNPWMEMLLTSLSLAVAAIPEGLPAVVTIALAMGVRKMAKRKALVRKLPSVETLGCASVICTDKTGTLTKNEMTVRKIYVDRRYFSLEGAGYNPSGDFKEEEKILDPKHSVGLMRALEIAVLCNSAELHGTADGWKIAGDPTEAALLVAAKKAGLDKKQLEEENPFLEEIPFESSRKRMSVLRRTLGRNLLYVKGAPDILLKLSSRILLNDKIQRLTEEDKKEIEKANHQYGSNALRVLGVAFREIAEESPVQENLEEDLVFVGLLAMMDPPRPEVKKAIAVCREAGIRPVMITGDHKQTALAVAKELELLEKDSQVLEGSELDSLSEKDFEKRVEKIAVYARVSAEHKLKIVKAWRDRGFVVAMTGDGVNDAPAIRQADIGIAMGLTGTDVTKEASDFVILDDNFASIVNAVEEGRGIYDNISKFINYLLSCNIAEILVIFFGMLLGLKDPQGRELIPLSAVQLLWMNLITDGFPAVALALDPLDPQAMKRPPRDPREPLLSGMFLAKIFKISLIIAIGTLAACFWGIRESVFHAQSLTLTLLITLQFLRVEMVRHSYHISFFSNRWLLLALGASFVLQLFILYSPSLQTLFNTVPLGWDDWAVVAGVGSLVWLFGSLRLPGKKNQEKS